jgi:hypothetical protein
MGYAGAWKDLAVGLVSGDGSTDFSIFSLGTNSSLGQKTVNFNGNIAAYARSNSALSLAAYNGQSVELAHKQNAVAAVYSQPWQYGIATGTNGLAESRNANAISASSSGNCFIGQGGTGGYGPCANNTVWGTHTMLNLKQYTEDDGEGGTDTVVGQRTLVIDGNNTVYDSEITSTTSVAGSYYNIAARAGTDNAAGGTKSQAANISIGSFRVYNRVLESNEIYCNYLVDLARFQGVYDPDLNDCGEYLNPVPLTSLTIGGNNCTDIIVTSDTSLTCTVPASTRAPSLKGPVDVAGSKTETGTVYSDTLTNGYRYIGPPGIIDVSPTYGTTVGGETVTITGDEFMESTTAPSGYHAVNGLIFSGTTANGQYFNTGIDQLGTVKVEAN